MAAETLKMEKVGPKEWKFEHPPGEAQVRDAFSDAIDIMQEGNDGEAEKILRKIIAASPLHIDAYHHLALLLSYRGDVKDAFDLWSKAVGIGRSAFPREFVPGEDRLEWGWLENRPFLRAYHGLGMCFLDAGRAETAHVIFNHLLAMNPSDNQGIRGLAVQSGFAMGRSDEVLRICGKYKDDTMADTLYGRPLAFFQMGKKAQAEKAMIRAVSLLPEVARELLKKRHQMPKGMTFDSITVGGADEAYDYWQRMGGFWKETEGALAFLADILSRCQQKASATKH